MPRHLPGRHAPRQRRVRLPVLLLTLLLAGCCHTLRPPATGVHVDLPEVGEVSPRQIH